MKISIRPLAQILTIFSKPRFYNFIKVGPSLEIQPCFLHFDPNLNLKPIQESIIEIHF